MRPTFSFLKFTDRTGAKSVNHAIIHGGMLSSVPHVSYGNVEATFALLYRQCQALWLAEHETNSPLLEQASLFQQAQHTFASPTNTCWLICVVHIRQSKLCPYPPNNLMHFSERKYSALGFSKRSCMTVLPVGFNTSGLSGVMSHLKMSKTLDSFV